MKAVGFSPTWALTALTVMILSLAACGDRAKPSDAVFGQCVTASQVDVSGGVRLLRLVPDDAGRNRPTCRAIFETLSPQVPDEKQQEILILTYFVDTNDIERDIQNCGLSGRRDLPFFRWQVSQTLRECRDSRILNTLTSLTMTQVDLGDFIPSDYRNNDLSVMYWDRDDAEYGPMTAGIFESETHAVVPVCLHFHEKTEAPRARAEQEMRTPKFLDEIETCLSRFVHLN